MNRREFLAAPAVAPALAAQAESGFTALFDGKSLAGWSVQEGPESAFFVEKGDIVGSPQSDYPTWLRFDRQFENFDLRCEFFVRGWTDGGIYFHAPEHGRPTWCGMNIKIFHDQDKDPRPNSMGALFPLIAPKMVNVRNRGEWNAMRILMDWPQLRVWVNGEVVQDIDVESVPELRHRLRRGYIGLSALSYPLRFRNLRIRELPDKEKWETLYAGPGDMDKWYISDTNERNPAKFVPYGNVLWADGAGHLATKEQYRDFVLHAYIRAPRHHNGGVLFRTEGKGLSRRRYEIQLHNVEEAHYPTGSLYSYKRGSYPKIEDEKWYLFQLVVQGKNCLVRINGDTVLEYDRLQDVDEGHIELQAHQPGTWTEFKDIRIRRL